MCAEKNQLVLVSVWSFQKRTEGLRRGVKFDIVGSWVPRLKHISSIQGSIDIQVKLLSLGYRKRDVLYLESKSCGGTYWQTAFVEPSFLRQWFVGRASDTIRSMASMGFVVFRYVFENSGRLWIIIYSSRSESGTRASAIPDLWY